MKKFFDTFSNLFDNAVSFEQLFLLDTEKIGRELTDEPNPCNFVPM